MDRNFLESLGLEDGVIGPWFMAPQEWLPGAKSIISFFFPFTQAVCDGEARSQPDGYAVVTITTEVKDKAELTNVINKLGQIQSVYQVKRSVG